MTLCACAWSGGPTAGASATPASPPRAARAAGLPRLVPDGRSSRAAAARSLALSLEPGETEALLREVPEVYRTQIQEVLLAALALAFAGGSGVPALLVDLEGHGREDIGA